MKKYLFLFLLLSLHSIVMIAGGFQVRLQGQKQTGIGLIGTPFAYGASSIFYNPGGLALVPDQFSFSAGVSGIKSNHIFSMTGTDYQARTDNPMSTPFYAYGMAKIGDHFAAGIGVYTPYGSTAQWDHDWAGRYLIQEISLTAIYIQPTIAYQVNEKFGIGAGLVYAIGSVDFTRALYYNENSSVNLEGDASDIGFNVGLFFRPVEDIHIGASYRSAIIMEVEDGDAAFDVPSSLGAAIPSENKFSAELPLPGNIDFGISADLSEQWTLAFELNYVMWSIYDSLNFTFEENGEQLDSSNPRLYNNTLIPRIGAEYRMNEVFTFRAGVYYDPSPTHEDYFTPETVSLNTIAFTLGASIEPLEGLSIDISYLELHGLKADKAYQPAGFSGTYKTMTFIPGIGLSYQF